MTTTPNVLPVPNEPWLDRLRRGHAVYLTKEKEFAKIAFAWEPPEPLHRSGRIAIERQNQFFGLQEWFVDIHGKGLDGSQLLQPVEGSLPESNTPISEPIVRHLHRAIENLDRRLENLERVIENHGYGWFE